MKILFFLSVIVFISSCNTRKQADTIVHNGSIYTVNKKFDKYRHFMENTLTREEAIKGMTIWAAKACFLDYEAGSLETGKKADFIILDKDLMQVAGTDISNSKVLMTYVGGKKCGHSRYRILNAGFWIPYI